MSSAVTEATEACLFPVRCAAMEDEKGGRRGEGEEQQWSEAVEELVDGGDVQGAISLLESHVSNLQSQLNSSDNMSLACALTDLADLYSSQGLSLKADELRTRALLIKLRSQQSSFSSLSPPSGDSKVSDEETAKKNHFEESATGPSPSSVNGDDDDWEAIADYASTELLSPPVEAGVSNLTLENREFQTPKRRGRGSFLYQKNGLYSDQVADVDINDSVNEDSSECPKEASDVRNLRYGTSHVLVLADFPPSTRTTDLEKAFESFRDRGFVIRWINDTTALAVFRTPSLAQEALTSIRCPYVVRSLDENDDLLSSLSATDLEPPYPRPKTSARTAQRLIAQGMGRKLSTTFGTSELKKQEEARRNRLHTRQKLRDEAWGPDDP